MDVKKLSELDAVTSVSPSDLVEISMDNGDSTYTSKKVVYSDFTKELSYKTINFVVGDGVNEIFSGTKGYVGPITYNGNVKSWSIVEVSETPVSGSIVIDVWKDTSANYPPTVAERYRFSGYKPLLLQLDMTGPAYIVVRPHPYYSTQPDYWDHPSYGNPGPPSQPRSPLDGDDLYPLLPID